MPLQRQREGYGIGDGDLDGSLYDLLHDTSFHSFNTLTSLFPLLQRVLWSLFLPTWVIRRAANMVTTFEIFSRTLKAMVEYQLDTSSESA
jgi:hypothetical protein